MTRPKPWKRGDRFRLAPQMVAMEPENWPVRTGKVLSVRHLEDPEVTVLFDAKPGHKAEEWDLYSSSIQHLPERERRQRA
ncbi:MAG: hypothetical protein KGJ23_08565 [Euryarchaeota archaeon]|nr:hypothetical protein [Euryarchaeota archaeon]MDE1836655.1 hypothetical protein [Euryarchaeota archaeon]MDE1880316.1 hypothetical protein [Euryarchaeota archaeon]MDE2044625.1 hypothetical protein [Thermoplasmata archaeon]